MRRTIKLYPSNLKNWILDREKAPGSSQKKSPHISNMGTFFLARSRKLFLRPKTNSLGWMGILGIVVFLLATLMLFERKHRSLKEEERVLQSRITILEEKKQVALQEQRILLQEIASQNDPDWIEMVLIRKLGLIPRGQKKILLLENGT